MCCGRAEREGIIYGMNLGEGFVADGWWEWDWVLYDTLGFFYFICGAGIILFFFFSVLIDMW